MHAEVSAKKEIKTKREKEIYMENREILQKKYISIQRQKVIYQIQKTLIILLSIICLMMKWRLFIRQPLNVYKTVVFLHKY